MQTVQERQWLVENVGAYLSPAFSLYHPLGLRTLITHGARQLLLHVEQSVIPARVPLSLRHVRFA